MGNTNYSFLKRISFLTKFYENYVYYFHNQTMKPHEYYPWQDYSFCKVNKARASLSTNPSWVRPAHKQISVIEEHVDWSAKFQQ